MDGGIDERFPPELRARYEVVELIGRGGTALVYRARHRALDRAVAVKVLRTPTPEMTARMEREARVLTRLACPQIVQLLDFGREGDRVYLVFELIEGRTLDAAWSEARPPLETALHCAHELAVALEAAHAAGVVHRDVKPANAFVLDDGRVKLGDFGLARTLDETRITGPHDLLGTPVTMAPEQVLGEDAGPAADVYGLGGVLFWLLTGKFPFVALTGTELVRAKLVQPARRVRALRPDVAPAIDELVARALERDEGRRPASMQEFRVRLAELLRPSGGPAPAPSLAPPPRAHRAPRSDARPVIALAVGLGVLGLLAWMRAQPPAAPRSVASAAIAREPSLVELLEEARGAAALDPLAAAGEARERGDLPPALRLLARDARVEQRELLARAPGVLDSTRASEAERRQIYDALTPLRVMDRLLDAYGEPGLGAERALGERFATGIADAELATARVLGDGRDAPSLKDGERAVLELDCGPLGERDLLRVAVRDWRLVLHRGCVRDGRAYHGVDISIFVKPFEVRVRAEDLPCPGGTAPPAPPVAYRLLAVRTRAR